MHRDASLFREASIQDFTNALMMAQTWGRERVYISDYFGDQPYIVIEEELTIYAHNTAQWVMKDFFEGLALKKVKEVNLDRGACLAPVYENIERDQDKFFRGYKHAAITYVSETGEKALVQITKNTYDDIIYKAYVSPDRSSLMADWLKMGREKNLYRGKKITADCKFPSLVEMTWDDVILPAGTKKMLQSIVSRSTVHRAVRVANKLSLKRGFILSSDPGNGKTTAVRVIVKELPPDFSAIIASPSHMEYSRDIKNICQMARDLSPCLLVFEDIDWIAEDREQSGDAGKLIELMNQMDGLEEFSNVITVGTTNSVETIEKAIKNRPGRFDRIVKITNPDEDCRRQMIKLFTRNYTAPKTLNVERIVKFTEELSGAHMFDLCGTAAEKAIEDESYDPVSKVIILRDEHFEDAIKEVKNKNYTSYLEAKSKGEKRVQGFMSRFDDI
jgi:hypothetical protein